MSGIVCSLCGAVVCQHQRYHDRDAIHGGNHNYHPRNPYVGNVLRIGERVGEPIDYVDVNSDRLDDDGNPNVGKHNSKKETPNQMINNTTPLSSKSTDWSQCNICRNQIHKNYLDQHIKMHVFNAERKVVSSATEASSTAIVRVSDYTTTQTETKTETQTTWSSLMSNSSSTKSKPVIQSIEKYKFRNLNRAAAISSASKSGRYSDFTLVFWTDELVSVSNSSYYGTGYTSYVSKDWERLSIHTVYDSLEDYYTLSCKLSRRGQHSSYDTDDCIPDRICYQNELMTEIKRAILFFKVSPKVAYRLFRKLFKEELHITYDPKDGSIESVQTASNKKLAEKLKTSHTGTISHAMERYHGLEGYHGWGD
jgi:hypothetical protein